MIATGTPGPAPDLVAVTLVLRPERPGRLPAFGGRLVQGWWLGHLRRIDPDLATRLHDEGGQRPYACAAPRGLPPVPPGALAAVTPDLRLIVRLSGWTPALVAHLLDLVERPPAGLLLGDVPCVVDRAVLDPAAPPATFAGLIERHLLAPAPGEDGRDVSLEFLSPAAFRRAETPLGRPAPLPFPDPQYVWGGLFLRWQEATPLPLHPALYAGLASRVGVARFAGESARALVTGLAPAGPRPGGRAGQWFVGYVGRCSYWAPRDDPDLGRTMHLLARFAAFAGVGHGTAYGFGQVRVGER